MKGLLLKDMLILKNQKKTMLMIVILGIALSLTMQITSVIAYFMMLGCMLALGTFAYDEMDNGYSFLFTLPVSRKTYVREKYLFMITWVLICAVFGIICCGILVLTGLGKLENGWSDIPEYTLSMLTVILLIIAVSVPLRVKFGSERSRIVIYIIVGAGLLLGVIVSRIAGPAAESAKALIAGLDPAKVIPILAAVSVILLLISEQITQKIIAKKEF